MINLEDSNITEMVNTDCSVVMFTADFSGPCVAAAEMFDIAAQRKGNQIDFYTFDLDGNTKFPKTIGLRAIPLFAFFISGELQETIVGAIELELFITKLEEIFND